MREERRGGKERRERRGMWEGENRRKERGYYGYFRIVTMKHM